MFVRALPACLCALHKSWDLAPHTHPVPGLEGPSGVRQEEEGSGALHSKTQPPIRLYAGQAVTCAACLITEGSISFPQTPGFYSGVWILSCFSCLNPGLGNLSVGLVFLNLWPHDVVANFISPGLGLNPGPGGTGPVTCRQSPLGSCPAWTCVLSAADNLCVQPLCQDTLSPGLYL